MGPSRGGRPGRGADGASGGRARRGSGPVRRPVVRRFGLRSGRAVGTGPHGRRRGKGRDRHVTSSCSARSLLGSGRGGSGRGRGRSSGADFRDGVHQDLLRTGRPLGRGSCGACSPGLVAHRGSFGSRSAVGTVTRTCCARRAPFGRVCSGWVTRTCCASAGSSRGSAGRAGVAHQLLLRTSRSSRIGPVRGRSPALVAHLRAPSVGGWSGGGHQLLLLTGSSSGPGLRGGRAGHQLLLRICVLLPGRGAGGLGGHQLLLRTGRPLGRGWRFVGVSPGLVAHLRAPSGSWGGWSRWSPALVAHGLLLGSWACGVAGRVTSSCCAPACSFRRRVVGRWSPALVAHGASSRSRVVCAGASPGLVAHRALLPGRRSAVRAVTSSCCARALLFGGRTAGRLGSPALVAHVLLRSMWI